jgi:DNA invertase Pin-like site-specific DNA recombinase
MRLVAYLRVSSESQLDGFGLDNQERAVRAWAKLNGHKVVEWCRDEGVSGTLEAWDRPG